MGHHLTDAGDFKSDKHDLPENRVRLNLENPRSLRALMVLSADYEEHDPEFANDLRCALAKLHPDAYTAGSFCRVMDANGYFYGQPGMIIGVEGKQPHEDSMVLRILCHVATTRGTRKLDAQQVIPGLNGWSPGEKSIRLRLPIQVHPLGGTDGGEATRYMGELQSGIGSFQALGDDETNAIKGVIQQVVDKLPNGLPEGVELTA